MSESLRVLPGCASTFLFVGYKLFLQISFNVYKNKELKAKEQRVEPESWWEALWQCQVFAKPKSKTLK